MERGIAIGFGIVGLVVVSAAIAWYLGLAHHVLLLLPNECDPGNYRLHRLEADPVTTISITGVTVSRRVANPAYSDFGGQCSSATYSVEFSYSDPGSAYNSLRNEVARRGWQLVSEAPPDTPGETGSSYYRKTIEGWPANLELGQLRVGGPVVMVLRAPPAKGG